MRGFLKGLALSLMVVCGIAAIISVIALFTDSPSHAESNTLYLGASLSSLLLSGAVWLLADIAESTAKLLRPGDETRREGLSITQ